MATYYVELDGGRLQPDAALKGGDLKAGVSFGGAVIYPATGGGGGGGNMQTKSVSYTPSETAISASVTPDPGYDGLYRVNVSVGAISSTYVGSGITQRTSSDLSASGATVTAPAGYYSVNATKTIPNASTPTLELMSINASGDIVAEIDYQDAGYVDNNTYTLTQSSAIPVQAAQTIYPSASDQSIASGKYLTGAQTIKGVTYTNLTAGNIKKDVVVEIGDSADSDRIVSVTGTYEGGGSSDFFDMTLPSGVLTTTQTRIKEYSCANRTAVTEVRSTTVTNIETRAFAGCTSLTNLFFPSAELGNYGAVNNPNLETVILYRLSGNGYNQMNGNPKLKAVDLTNSNGRLDNTFQTNCGSLDTLILRSSSLFTLHNTSCFNSTKFASGGAGGTIYIPKVLYDALGTGTNDYKAASNWSTIDGYGTITWAKIEGSYYETHYADGTVIS